MDRRALLKQMAVLGLAVAVPAISLERSYFFGPWVPEQPPMLWGDAIHDDAAAPQWYFDHGKQIPKGLYRSGTLLKSASSAHDRMEVTHTGGLQLFGPPGGEGAMIKYARSAEFGQNSVLAAEATRLIKGRVGNDILVATPELSERIRQLQLVESLPPVDYSAVTPEQARAGFYRAAVEYFEAWRANYDRRRAHLLARWERPPATG